MIAMDRHKQTLKAFAPSDVETLLSLPEMEAKYRLLRNEWLTLHSRLKQADERVFQAERSGHQQEIDDARAERAKVSTKLGVYRKLTLLAKARATAEIYQEVATNLLPLEIRRFIDQCVTDVLKRDNDDVVRGSGTKPPDIEDYRLFDALLEHWSLRPASEREDAA